MNDPQHRADLLATAGRLRDQAARLRSAARSTNNPEARARDLAAAQDCDMKADRMETEAQSCAG